MCCSTFRLLWVTCAGVAFGAAVRDREGGAGMSPIAHSRRLSSPAAASRHAVDAVVVGNPVPLGISPLVPCRAALAWSCCGAGLEGNRGLIAEYAGAQGYPCRCVSRFSWAALSSCRWFPRPCGTGLRSDARGRRCASKSCSPLCSPVKGAPVAFPCQSAFRLPRRCRSS
jgi:hypothetical protein